jgi:hypothetical protein
VRSPSSSSRPLKGPKNRNSVSPAHPISPLPDRARCVLRRNPSSYSCYATPPGTGRRSCPRAGEDQFWRAMYTDWITTPEGAPPNKHSSSRTKVARILSRNSSRAEHGRQASAGPHPAIGENRISRA